MTPNAAYVLKENAIYFMAGWCSYNILIGMKEPNGCYKEYEYGENLAQKRKHLGHKSKGADMTCQP